MNSYSPATSGADAAWSAPFVSQPLHAAVHIPGSKSLTNRELVLSALADGPSLLRRPLHSRDTELMASALRALGATIDEVPGDGKFGLDWLITPGPLHGGGLIDCGLAGTVMRFVPPVAALAVGDTSFDGDEGARRRPMATTITALRSLGITVLDDDRRSLPFTVSATGRVPGGELTIDASSSSQFVSGLLLVAALYENGLTLHHSGDRLPSMPHIDMTIAALHQRGVQVSSPEPGTWVVAPGAISARDVDIEPDLSNAEPFLAAALITGGSVTMSGWPESTTQVGNDLLDILPKFGATVAKNGDTVTVTGALTEGGKPHISGVQLDLSTGGELVPNLIALCALADSPSDITGIGHIRHHETDRIAALVTEINNLGGAATELSDGIHIEPVTLKGGLWRSYHDHRMATTGALLGLAVPGMSVENIETTAKTLPEFTELWHQLTHGDAPNDSASGSNALGSNALGSTASGSTASGSSATSSSTTGSKPQ